MKKFSPTLHRNFALCLLACAATFAHSAPANSLAAYPDKPIRIVVPAAAGGAADTVIRVISTALAQRLGQPVVIDNKPGASGAIGLDAVAKAAPDGYTLGANNVTNFSMAPHVVKTIPYSTATDFTPIAMNTTSSYLLGVPASLPAKSIPELASYAKRNPSAIFFGSSGNGSSLHIVMELIRSNADIPATHVPYKSSPAAEMDLMAGQIQMLVDNFSSMAPNVKAGKVRALAITSAKRSPLLPDVPTVAELGIKAAEAESWSGIVGPAKMPPEIVQKLNTEINNVLSDPKVQKQLLDVGTDAKTMSVAEFSAFIKAQDAKWGAVIKQSNITAD